MSPELARSEAEAILASARREETDIMAHCARLQSQLVHLRQQADEVREQIVKLNDEYSELLDDVARARIARMGAMP
jgi:peptidoglycan hydrolase CwlO-like protein